jgi:D-alanyl-D-alanine carboxypeptidase
MKKLISTLMATLLLASVVLTGCGGVFANKDENAAAKSALKDLLNEQVKEQDIPGMIMAVRLADGTVIWDTSGYTSPSGKERWSANTVSAIGSVTKTFTAVVVMQFIEEGKLSLDDTIDAWFPAQPNGGRITIRMLLSHTSGLANYNTALGDDIEKWEKEWTPEELIAESNKLGPVSEPGSSKAHYSNTNYYLLGLIVEKISGHSWADEVESRIIKPLDLGDTSFLEKEGIWGGVMVPAYTRTPDGYLSTMEFPWYPDVTTSWAAGELVSTASDMMTFASAFFDGKLVSKETLAVMAQPLGTDGERDWALGGAAAEIADHPGFGMGGDIPGYHAFFIGMLDSKLIVTALVNAEEGDVIMPSLSALQYLIQ